MIDESALASRLIGASSRWITVQGTLREWRRRDLTDIGFHRYVASLAQAGTGAASSLSVNHDEADPPDGVYEAVLSVSATDAGARRRAETISRIGDEWLPDLVVVDGDTFWARTGDVVQTNGGDPHHHPGGADFARLLDPQSVPAGHSLTSLDRTEIVAGRTCDVVLALPRPPSAEGYVHTSDVFTMIAGGDSFLLAVDQDTGILLRVAKLVDGREAEIREFLAISVDGPVADDAFQRPG